MKKKKGLWIPKEILDDEQLDWTNKILLSEIYSLSKLEKGCFASNQYFGDFLGIEKSAASKRISKLKKLGYISCRNVPKGQEIDHRIITRSNRHKNMDVVPKKRGGSSRKTRGVVPTEQGGSSTGNTINTTTNTDIKKQLEIHNNTGPSILGNKVEKKPKSQLEVMNETFDEAGNFLCSATSLGEEILNYTNPDLYPTLKSKIGAEEFKRIEVQLHRFHKAATQLGYN